MVHFASSSLSDWRGSKIVAITVSHIFHTTCDDNYIQQHSTTNKHHKKKHYRHWSIALICIDPYWKQKWSTRKNYTALSSLLYSQQSLWKALPMPLFLLPTFLLVQNTPSPSLTKTINLQKVDVASSLPFFTCPHRPLLHCLMLDRWESVSSRKNWKATVWVPRATWKRVNLYRL